MKLIAKALILVLITIFGFNQNIYSQCTAPFSNIPDTICSNEIFTAQESTPFLTKTEWKFGLPSIDNLSTINNLGNLGNSLSNSSRINILKVDSNFYGFVKKSNASQVYRYEFGTSLSNIPTVVALTIPSFSGNTSLSDDDIDIINRDGNWYGYTPIRTGSAILRYNFGNSITNDTVTVTNLGNLNNQISLPYALDVEIFQDSIYLFVASWSNNTAIVYNMGTSPEASTAQWFKAINLSSTSPSISNTSCIEGYMSCNEKLIFTGGYSSDNIVRLNFNGNFNNTPVVDQINSQAIVQPTCARLKLDKGYPELFINPRSNASSLSILEFKDSITQTTGITQNNFSQSAGTLNGLGLDLSYSSEGLFLFFTTSAGNVVKHLKPFDSNTYNESSTESSCNLSITNDGWNRYSFYGEDSLRNKYYFTDSVYLNQSPIITSSISNLCLGDTVLLQATDSSFLSGVSWEWKIDPENLSLSSQDTSIIFSTAGYKTIKVYAQLFSCIDSNLSSVYVNPLPTAAFSVDTACQGEILTLVNESILDTIDTIATFTWLFESDTIFGANPVYGFNEDSTKNILLNIATSNGCSANSLDSVFIKTAPIASFKLDSTCLGENTQFINLSGNSGNYTSFWEFGDGQTSTQFEPTHVYLDTGSYLVNLKTLSINGCDDSTYLEIMISEAPEVDFVLSASPVCQNNEIELNDFSISSHPISNRFLVLSGDTQPDISTPFSIALTGNNQAKYIVVSGTNCVSDSSFNLFVNAQPQITYSFDQLCQEQLSHFSAEVDLLNNQTPINFAWNFSDNSNYYDSNFTKETNVSGLLSFELTVSTDSGCTASISDTLTVMQAPTLDINFKTPYCSDVILENITEFSVDSNDLPNEILWQIAESNGQTSSSTSGIDIQISSAGSTNIYAELSTTNNCIVRDTLQFEVYQSPNLKLNSDTICEQSLINLSSNYSGSNYEYLWQFNDGSSNSNATLQYLFQSAGTENIILELKEKISGCKARDTAFYYVAKAINASISNEYLCDNSSNILDAEILMDSLDAIQSIIWRANGIIFSNTIPATYIPESEVINLSLQINSNFNCGSIVSKTLNVPSPPISDFNLSATFGEIPFNLTAESNSPSLAHYWFLDSDTIGDENVIDYIINNSGTYWLNLLVIDSLGCSSTQSKNVSAFEGFTDLGIKNTEYNSASGTVKSLLINYGINPVYGFDIAYSFLNGNQVIEHREDTLVSGAFLEILSQNSITTSKENYTLCAEILAVNSLEDQNISNNKFCINADESFDVFPNPAFNWIKIPLYSEKNGAYTLNIYNDKGQLIHSESMSVTKGYQEIYYEIEYLSAGIYLLVLKNELRAFQTKLVKR